MRYRLEALASIAAFPCTSSAQQQHPFSSWLDLDDCLMSSAPATLVVGALASVVIVLFFSDKRAFLRRLRGLLGAVGVGQPQPPAQGATESSLQEKRRRRSASNNSSANAVGATGNNRQGESESESDFYTTRRDYAVRGK